MRNSDSIAVRLRPDIRGALEQIAGPGGLSRAVREALAEYVQRNRKANTQQGQQTPAERRL